MITTSETGVTYKAGGLDGSVVRVSGSRTLHRVHTRGQWRALIVVRNDNSTRLAADYHSLPRPLRYKLETLAQRAEVMLTKLLQVLQLTNV